MLGSYCMLGKYYTKQVGESQMEIKNQNVNIKTPKEGRGKMTY